MTVPGAHFFAGRFFLRRATTGKPIAPCDPASFPIRYSLFAIRYSLLATLLRSLHEPHRRGPDGPDREDQDRRRFDLRAVAGGAGARAPAALLHAGPPLDAGRQGGGPGAAARGARRRGRPLRRRRR